MHARDYQPGEAIAGTVYRVVRLIGAGGMGTVYDVEDTTIGKRYVLKTLHPRLGAREDLARRMQNEARTLARLHHPNIVEVITAGVTADDLRLPFYVMERLSGQSLRLVLEKKGQLELTHSYHIGIDLLDALDHAHDKSVVHRDVKPDNIFLHRTAAGVTVTKLLDFGIVSLLDAPGAETAGRFLGTLRYAAPEQLRGDKPTPKTDVYAAALVLYEMLAGHGPFDDEGDPHKVGAAHLRRAPPPLSMFVPVPGELDALLGAALAKDPDSRPRDAFSFAASLRNLKRRLNATPRAQESSRDVTENRATSPAVLGAPSAANLDIRQASPSGPFVISPGAAPSSMPGESSNVTHAGMVPPTVGQSLATATRASSTGTSPMSIDRQGPTQSQALDSTRRPSGDTEAIARSRTGGGTHPLGTGSHSAPPATRGRDAVMTARPAGEVQGLAPLDWPAERAALPSEAPQVRSLHAGAFAHPGRGALVASTVGMLGLGAMILFVVVSRPGSSTATHATVLSGAAAVAPALGPPPRAQPIVLVPAPTIAPPALEDPGAHDVGRIGDNAAAASVAPVGDKGTAASVAPVGDKGAAASVAAPAPTGSIGALAPSASAADAASSRPGSVHGAVPRRATAVIARPPAAGSASASRFMERPGPGF